MPNCVQCGGPLKQEGEEPQKSYYCPACPKFHAKMIRAFARRRKLAQQRIAKQPAQEKEAGR